MAKALIAPNPETALVQKQASELMPQSALDRYKLIVDQLVVTDEQSLAYANDVARRSQPMSNASRIASAPPQKGLMKHTRFYALLGIPSATSWLNRRRE